MIPVRDGTQLSTDLYFPEKSNKRYPVVLIRTPYNKTLLKEYGEYYSTKGYVVAIQDVRGKYGSEGTWNPYIFEGKDGYDVIEWLAGQNWCNGKVGMVGGSYSGSVQLAAAIENPPHLVTIIPNITPATPYFNTPYENGAFALGWSVRWTDIVSENISGPQMNVKFNEAFTRNWYSELYHLPVSDLDSIIIGKKINFWQEWIQNPPGDSIYSEYLRKIDRIKIPVFLQSGWFDVAGRGTKLIYRELLTTGNDNTKLIIGPWVHSDKSSKQLGPLYLGEEAGIDLFGLYTDWFDYWLKGEDNGIMNEPTVQLFNIGPNKWISDDTYPLEDTEITEIFLSDNIETSDKRVNSLVFSASEINYGDRKFDYDPSDPAPGFAEMMKKNKFDEYKRIMDMRKDVILFETSPLTDALTIAGPLELILYASSSAIDTDFTATLTGIDINGKVFPIGQTFGIIRARYRESVRQAEFIEPEEIYDFKIDLSHTFYTLSPGERLRLEISSSSFPDFSRNLNTGENNQTSTDYLTAEQHIYFTREYPSKLIFWKLN